MRRSFIAFTSLLFLSACGRLDQIPYSPPLTPQSWLAIQPGLPIKIGALEIIIVQPSTSIIVYLLGLVTIAAGVYFLRIRNGQRARLWWGIALLLWGAGALLAGTSYEAFSYHIKCAGREACVWTSGWEVLYLLLSVASLDAMLVAVSYSCTLGWSRKTLRLYAVINLILYSALLLIGTLIPVQFLVSFELLILFAVPTVLILLILNGWRYFKYKQRLDGLLLVSWIGLALILAAYFGYLILGITPALWRRGIWFSENDVLHFGLILWMLYLALVLARHVQDWPQPAQFTTAG
jgi:hypothetical protein